MIPTVLVGDHGYAAKGPFRGELERGDIVAFRYPLQPQLIYLKRVVALPGEEVRVEANRLTVDGERAQWEGQGEVLWVDPTCRQHTARSYRETLGGRSWDVQVNTGLQGALAQFPRDEAAYVVPEGHVFVLGDNRNNAEDSRKYGAIPTEDILGVVHRVWLSWDECAVDGVLRTERFGLSLR